MIRSTSCCLLFLAAVLPAFPQDTRYAPKNQLIPAPECLTLGAAWEGGYTPCDSASHSAWLKDIQHWRFERRIRIGYNGWRYDQPAVQWIRKSFIQPQMMVQDRYFYDPDSGKYTVDRYLDDLERRYGGIDSVLIWPTYPNMGIDDRNQQDMIRCMPGGLSAVKQMVADFHGRGVRVLFPMMMWDQGTRDPREPWPQAIAGLMQEIDADGINGDTQDGVPLAFSEAAEKIGHPLVFEPEGSPSDEALAWNLMTWGQYGGQFKFVPGVDRFRWLESRHMVNISDRWNRSKTDDLQYAFFNGEGWESWENIWGIWNGITPRDGEATRRIATIERSVAKFLTGDDWEPFYPMHLYGVYASRWSAGDESLWTIVNRNEYDVAGRQMSVPAQDSVRYFDLYRGTELKPEFNGATAILSFPLEAHGFGAVLAAHGEPVPDIQKLMSRMRSITAAPLSTYSNEWKTLPQRMVDVEPTKPAASIPEGMVRAAGGDYVFKVAGVEIEGSDDIGVDVQYPWEDTPRRFHEHRMQIKPFYIDKYPVTNAEFKKFLDSTRYRPKDDIHFLRDWKGGTYPDGWGNKPVTWVSLDDARAYAKWAGKRLPHEWEWQFAAQGSDGRIYPWGNEWQASAVPSPDQGRVLRGPDDVDAHPAGASAFGVTDMVGNVWQWTDEYVDEHTRGGILRGGDYYQPQGSVWYFPEAYRNDQHGKLLLMAPSYDRAGTLGFRCVVDAE
ncbi:MAG TPA: SUMF1/EgtB/PvdO family nonheme iron enzyme [Bryobacteraceae bacterium]|jgi:formylglycine-generating enzyme required for sulfatase activity|nr:SUMF1/EgtB/PvdO family nonheme iron enzyme [Bryobacteraceae bacterium]